MSQYDIAKTKAELFKLEQQAMPGEDVASAPNKQHPVGLAPIERIRVTRVPGSAKGRIITMAPDFDEALADFHAYR